MDIESQNSSKYDFKTETKLTGSTQQMIEYDHHATQSEESQKNDHSQMSIENSQNIIVQKNKKISKIKPKQTLYGFKMILKFAKNDLHEKQQNYKQIILKPIPGLNIFYVAGDIIVVLRRLEDDLRNNSMNEFRNIVSVEKCENSVSFEIESSKPIKQMSEIIYYLENSQDQSSYEFAQHLKNHQQTVYMLQDQIIQLQQNYLSSQIDFPKLIQERKNFIIQQQKQLVEQSILEDDFSCVGVLSISLASSTISLSNLSIARPVIALIGAENEDLALQFLRKGFSEIYDYNSRYFISISNMQFQSRRQNDFTLSFDNFEIFTMDDIKIICECKIKSILIKFPPHLQFQGENVDILNNIEQIIYKSFIITPEHISQILKIRSEFNLQSPQNKQFPENYTYKQNLEIESFEQYMQNQIFLEKYYQDALNKIQQENDKKQQDADELKQKQKVTSRLTCAYRCIR